MWCASIPGASPSRRAPGPYARPLECVRSPLARRRPLGPRLPTLGDPASSSIAGRRASGFLQVSLSKVSRPQHRAHISPLCAEALPINASDFSLVTVRYCAREPPRSQPINWANRAAQPVLSSSRSWSSRLQRAARTAGVGCKHARLSTPRVVMPISSVVEGTTTAATSFW